MSEEKYGQNRDPPFWPYWPLGLLIMFGVPLLIILVYGLTSRFTGIPIQFLIP